MVSAIDATKPVNGVPASKADLRANLQAAKDEIEALQGQDANSLAALGLSPSDILFAVITGNNLPDVPASFQTIMQSLDAQIDIAKAASGGGPITLASITDILTPSNAQRVAFQQPIDGGLFDSDFNFSEGSHDGRWLTLDTPLNSVTMTLPAPGGLSRPDGWLSRVTATSAANFAAISAPAGTLRFQTNRLGAVVTQTTVFLGLSRASGSRSLFDIYKDGPVYQIVGLGRTTETDDLRIGANQTVPGAALVNESLPAGAFPASLDLGGTKQTGGGREIIQPIAGNHTFLQANAGKTLEHTGGGAATWDVPALLPGTTVEIDNAIGGAITLNDTGSQTVLGGTTLASGGAGAVKWLNGNRVRFIGTT